MFPAQIPTSNPGGFTRCEERSQIMDYGKSLTEIQKTDMAVKNMLTAPSGMMTFCAP